MITTWARHNALDRRLFRQAALRESPVLDRVLPPLTHSADHGLLWFGVAGAGQRRAAVRGLSSLLLASALANVPAKRAARRIRPSLIPVPMPRQLFRQPSTSSIPSGHSASAAAFAVGVALEQRLLAAPVGVLAAGVAYGRVRTGVHFPGDVVAGLALGAACAVAVKRAWPAKPARPAVGRSTADAPALTAGDGLVLVINTGGGSVDRADAVQALLAEQLPKAEVVKVGDDLEDALHKAAARATVLGAMGGDGTLSCAAGSPWRRACRWPSFLAAPSTTSPGSSASPARRRRSGAAPPYRCPSGLLRRTGTATTSSTTSHSGSIWSW